MKQIFLLTLLSIITMTMFAQSSGSISYKETMKMDFEMDMPDMPEGFDISGMLPESTSAHK